MRRVNARTPRRGAALFVASAAVVLMAGCGGSSDDSSSANETANDGRNNMFAAYAECLQQNGVTVTIPSGGPRTRPSDGASRGPGGLPSGAPPSGGAGPGGGGPGGDGGNRGGGSGMISKPVDVDDATWEKAQTACAALRPAGRGGDGNGGNRGGGANAAYENCLKENGVTNPGGQLDNNDTTVQKAVETCEVLQPQASATPTA